jgi:hypothetical protein
MEEIDAEIEKKDVENIKEVLNYRTANFQFPLIGRGVGVRSNKTLWQRH